jgi:hypothetical protein
VVVSNAVEAGVTFVGMSGDGWSCASNAWTRRESLSDWVSYPPINITMQASSVGQLINQLSVRGGGRSFC